MCLIIQGNPKNISKEIIRKAFKENPDGFGLMYLSKDTNRVITKKFFTKNINKIFKTCREHFKKADQIALHFRITTQGNTDNKNCHPFQVLNQDNDQIDCFLMHNSPRLPSPLLSENMSDTYYFTKIILRPILKSNTNLIENEKFIDCIETIAQSYTDSRVLLLDNLTKSFQFIGKWHDHKGLKYSNRSLIPYQYTPNKKYFDDYEFNQDSNFGFNHYQQDINGLPKFSVAYDSEKPVYDSEYWKNTDTEKTTPKDLEDLHVYLDTLDLDEIVKLCKENPELISHYILANHSGYCTDDIKDCELYFDETSKKEIQVDDTKPLNKVGINE